MANTVEIILRARDEASAVVKKLGINAEELGQTIGTTLAAGVIGVSKAFQIATDASEILSGNYSKLGEVVGQLPGPFGAAAGSIVSAIGQMVEETQKEVDALNKLSAKTGASIEFLSEFQSVAKDANIEVSATSAALEVFARKLGGVETAEDGAVVGGQKLADVLDGLGVQIDQNASESEKYEQAILGIAERFATMEDGARKTALATQLFGKRGAELIPILNEGKDGINELREAARKLGVTLDSDTARAFSKLDDEQDKLSKNLAALEKRISAGLAPALLAITQRLNDTAEAQRRANEANKLAGLTWQGYQEQLASVVAEHDKVNEVIPKTTGIVYDVARALDVQRAAGRDAAHSVESLNDAWGDASDAISRGTGEAVKAASAAAELGAAQDRATAAAQRAKDTADKQKEAHDNLIGAFRSGMGALSKLELAQLAVSVATGKMTQADGEKYIAHRQLIDAFDKGFITYDQLIKRMTGLEQGTLSAKKAMENTGPQASAMGKQLEELGGKASSAAEYVGALNNKISGLTPYKRIDIDVVTTNRSVNEPGPSQYVGGGVSVPSGGNPSAPAQPTPTPAPSPPPFRKIDTQRTSISVGGTTINVNGANASAVAQRIARSNATTARAAALAASFGGI